MLARSYGMLGRIDERCRLQKAVALRADDARLLADYGRHAGLKNTANRRRALEAVSEH